MRKQSRRGAPLAERVRHWSTVDPSGCWLWFGDRDSGGYGGMRIGGRKNPRYLGAHRAAYMAFVGPIPDGMTVDHLCFVPNCVNPEHLRLLSPIENAKRQRTRLATACAKGHEWTEANTMWRYVKPGHSFRRCRACHNESGRRARRRAAAARREATS